MTRQEEIVKGFNESWSQYGINVSSNISNPINGITVNNPNGGRAVALNFIDGVNATKLLPPKLPHCQIHKRVKSYIKRMEAQG